MKYEFGRTRRQSGSRSFAGDSTGVALAAARAFRSLCNKGRLCDTPTPARQTDEPALARVIYGSLGYSERERTEPEERHKKIFEPALVRVTSRLGEASAETENGGCHMAHDKSLF